MTGPFSSSQAFQRSGSRRGRQVGFFTQILHFHICPHTLIIVNVETGGMVLGCFLGEQKNCLFPGKTFQRPRAWHPGPELGTPVFWSAQDKHPSQSQTSVPHLPFASSYNSSLRKLPPHGCAGQGDSDCFRKMWEWP